MDGFNNKNCDVKTATGTVVRLSSTAGIVLFITPNILDMKHILDNGHFLLPNSGWSSSSYFEYRASFN